MSNPARVLAPKSPDRVFKLAVPAREAPLNGDDSAIHLLRDFTSHNPVTFSSAMGIQEVKEKLSTFGVTFSVIVNRSDEVVGLLALKDLIGTLPMRLANQRGVSITDITAQEVMRPVWGLPSIRYVQLKDLKVSQLADIFNELHTGYLLVTETDASDSGERSVRGLLTADDLGRQLGIQIDQSPRPESFSDIVHAVRGKSD